jgi:hypothetical protein
MRKNDKPYPIAKEEIPKELENLPGGVILLRKIDEELGDRLSGEPVKVKHLFYKLALQCKFRVNNSKAISKDFIKVEKSKDIRPYGFLILKIGR